MPASGSRLSSRGVRRARESASRSPAPRTRRAFAELGFARIQLHADAANVASQRVAERAGYTREGVLRAWLEVQGEPRDHVLYSLLATECRTQTFGS